LSHGLYHEGLRWLDRALARSGRAASAARVQALAAAGTLAIYQGDYDRAATFSAEAVPLAEAIGDPALVGEALAIAGFLAYRLGDYERAERLLGTAHAELRQSGIRDPAALADAGFAVFILGCVALVQERFAPAAVRFDEALTLFRATGNAWGISDTEVTVAAVSFCKGDIPRAAARYAAALIRLQHRNLPRLVASSLLGLGAVAAVTGRPDAGARLLGAAEGLGATLGAPMFPSDRPVFTRARAALAAELGDERLRTVWQSGRELPVAQAIAQALEIAAAVADLSLSESAGDDGETRR
jgi:non-specific serine/threonine protein kinase